MGQLLKINEIWESPYQLTAKHTAAVRSRTIPTIEIQHKEQTWQCL